MADRGVTVKRRTFVISGLFGAFCSVRADVQGDDEVVVRFRADDSVQDTIPTILQQQLSITPNTSGEAKELASRVPPSRAIPVFVVIVGALTIPVILQMIKELLRQTYYGGVIVDTRSQPPSITSDPKIPGNLVTVIGSDGKVTQLTNDQLSPNILRPFFIKK